MRKWFAALLVVGWSSSALAQSTPFHGAPITLPGTVEAEDFDNGGNGIAYFDTTDGNQLPASYRVGESVDIEVSSEHNYNVGKIRLTEWLNYSVNVLSAGTYTLSARVSSLGQGGTFHIEFDGVNVTGPMTVPDTGAWQNWTPISTTVTLTAGTQTMKVVVDGLGGTTALGNLNYFTLATTLPGTVEAENFDNGGEGVAYHDTTADNQFHVYREEGVDIEASPSGGFHVGKTRVGEWMNYSVYVTAAGNYTLTARVASLGLGGTFHVEMDGVNVTGPINIQDTGDWEAWQTVVVPVTLISGPQTMRVVMDAVRGTTAIGNIDCFTFTADNPGPAERITLVQWNVHKGREECDKLNHFDCDPTFQEIAAYLNGVNADVVSLNEVTFNRPNYTPADEPAEFEMALEAATGRCWDRYFTPAEYPAAGNLGNLLLWRSSDPDPSCTQAPGRFRKVSVFSSTIQATADPRSVGGVTLMVGGRAVTFFSTHLCAPPNADPSCTPDQRKTQVDSLKNVIGNISAPRIVAGDFNAHPFDAEINDPSRGMIAAYDDLWAVAVNAGTANSNDLNEPTHGTDSRFDYVFGSRDGSISLVGARIDHPINPQNGWSFSDHSPVSVTLTIR